MNLFFIKQLLAALLGALFFGAAIVASTFLIFPVENWRELSEGEMFGVPYPLWIVSIIAAGGITAGVSYWTIYRNKLQQINDRLEELVRGEKLSIEEDTEHPDLSGINKLLQELETQAVKQTELSQRLATERAEEREKGLQEVVLQERNRLARELHDSVSQQLFAASMMMSAINEGNPPEDPAMRKQLGLIEKMIDQSQLEMRALLLHLRPAALREKPLGEGIAELLSELRDKVPMEIDWKIEPLKLEKGVEDHLFRILQEAVSNALRHSKAEKLTVILMERDNIIILRVADNGKGFNVTKESSKSSYGLKNMYERAIEIGGSMKIVSVENEGSRLEVKIPQRKTTGGGKID
ncbi:sensor histidine kinase [Evansella clarkii]|uniref:sensor histidine kinase n=1 Tax=Evansella clarkii TaxID=79879 RepID=UPI0009983BA0|nr:sensor histidine kinase [Evansella clarkii]